MVLYIGLMSGTSMDGVDAVLMDVNTHKLVKTSYMTYPLPLQQVIVEMAKANQVSLDALMTLDNELAHFYALVVDKLLEDYNGKESIEAIGCHGQTIRHCPEADTPYTLQLGNANLLAAKTNLKVVSDFRALDVALGGEGAPLAPLYHDELFSLSDNKVVVNIGGIANISFKDARDKVCGFDSGPGNVLMDAWVNLNQGEPYDREGKWALEGQVIDKLLKSFLNDTYFDKPYPKSIDKSYFSLEWLNNKLTGATYAKEDIQASLQSLTAFTISYAVKKVKKGDVHLVVTGGGAKNLGLLEKLNEYFHQVSTAENFGYESHYIEAMMCAWLAKMRLDEITLDLSAITGCEKAHLVGSVYSC